MHYFGFCGDFTLALRGMQASQTPKETYRFDSSGISSPLPPRTHEISLSLMRVFYSFASHLIIVSAQGERAWIKRRHALSRDLIARVLKPINRPLLTWKLSSSPARDIGDMSLRRVGDGQSAPLDRGSCAQLALMRRAISDRVFEKRLVREDSWNEAAEQSQGNGTASRNSR